MYMTTGLFFVNNTSVIIYLLFHRRRRKTAIRTGHIAYLFTTTYFIDMQMCLSTPTLHKKKEKREEDQLLKFR